jgi:N-methylhydantoinase A/oxoprolinase/acetone carboxylase beta subunit
MLLGIDVGGTFTDAVVMAENRLLAVCKSPTTHSSLLEGTLAAIDGALRGLDKGQITRVSLSTTLVTNTLVEGKADRAALMMMTGPGMDYRGLLPVDPCFLSGYIDHRGRIAAPPVYSEIQSACRNLHCDAYAVAGKFAVRNPVHEQQVAAWITVDVSPLHISLSSRVSGSLNLWRRANAAYYNAAVWRHFGVFAAAVQAALQQRHIYAPVYILKADGGTMPLAAASDLPVEAIFTGPAASVLGIMALCQPAEEAVSLDIGGTTTDIALWRKGLPLFAQLGAAIAGYPTSVQAFRLKSIGVGGDSWVRRQEGKLYVGPERRGPAMALNGPAPTLSDAMIVAGCGSFGNYDQAVTAMKMVAFGGQTPYEAAQTVLEQAAGQLCKAVEAMIAEQAAEPVYRVDDIIHQTLLRPELLIGIGGAAKGLVPFVARQLGVGYTIPENAEVANAIGAAAAKPTIDITLRADTSQGNYTVAELGLNEKLPNRNMRLEQVRQLTAECLSRRAALLGIPVSDMSVVYEEEFNLIRGFNTIGRVITCRMQLKPGVLATLSEQEGQHG